MRYQDTKSPKRFAVAVIAVGATWVAAPSAVPAATQDGCPAHEPRSIPANPWRASNAKLAPAGATQISLCRYSALNDHPARRPTASRRLRRPGLIRQLVGRFDALIAPPSGASACPTDHGSQIVALLAYPRHHAVMISVDLTGCGGVRNGNLHRTTANFGGHNATGPKLAAQLERLTS